MSIDHCILNIRTIMMFFQKITHSLLFVKNELSKNSCDMLFWLINFLPTIGGFSLFKEKIRVQFWFLHFSLLFYVYISGTVVYNRFYAKEAVDFVNSFFNISIFVLTFNAACWIVCKRSSIQAVLKLVKLNDELVRDSGRFSREHEAVLKNIKKIVLACYAFHFVNDILIFTTARVMDTNDLAVASSKGLNPMSGSPNMEICKAVLSFQELTAIVVVGTYDVMLMFLTTHTTAMCHILQLDINSLSQSIDSSNPDWIQSISSRINNIIRRHADILLTVKKLQNIYSVAIGVDFSNHAISVLLFFVLPLDVCLKFGPLVYHNLFVFFLYCLLGQILTTAAEKVEMAIYCCGWENFSQKDRNAVLFMLKQSQKPVMLLAANVVPIRIYTFANTMQMIYKFVTVFKV